ncbi:MAG: glutamate--tRNA ligase, partial [Leptolyngbyaceae cyanobacterium SL_5_9]|nr:glutamate--tRNA ligase [Leptolyngbyaceae cyanobacterium SL_5_9]
LHEMPAAKLTDLLIPYWQEAGYAFDAEGDRPWLEQVSALIGASLSRLDEAVPMTRYLFDPEMQFSEAAVTQLRQEGTAAALQGVLAALSEHIELGEASAQEIIKQVVKAENLKKGLVMRSLRAALTTDMQGPDLIQSWLLLHQHNLDQLRLKSALALTV